MFSEFRFYDSAKNKAPFSDSCVQITVPFPTKESDDLNLAKYQRPQNTEERSIVKLSSPSLAATAAAATVVPCVSVSKSQHQPRRVAVNVPTAERSRRRPKRE